jgi:hypothetical protein
LLIDSLEGLWDKADRYRRLALQTDRGQAARDIQKREHQQLADFIAAGDTTEAANVMRAHTRHQPGRNGNVADWVRPSESNDPDQLRPTAGRRRGVTWARWVGLAVVTDLRW